MSGPQLPTLDQLRVFLAVVEAGSFAAAARRLGRAASVVNYAIANLELQLGVALFERESTRKPKLTNAGRAILSDTVTVAAGLENVLAKARGIAVGLEAEIVVAIDSMLPLAPLLATLNGFRAAFPSVSLLLNVTALGTVSQLVADGGANLGITGPQDRRLFGLKRDPIGTIRLIPVAARDHPMAQHPKPIPGTVVRQHVQLVQTESPRPSARQEFGIVGARVWRLADLNTKHTLLLAGFGWGSMPSSMVAEDLAAGRLVQLELEAWDYDIYPLLSVHLADVPQGPAASWLLQRLRTLSWD
jgi:DNA-binding transcriptional LysR family regulator